MLPDDTEIIPPAQPDRRRRRWPLALTTLLAGCALLGTGIAIGSTIPSTTTNYLTVPGKTITVTAGPTTAPSSPAPVPTPATETTGQHTGNQVVTVTGFVPGDTYTLSYTAGTGQSGLDASIAVTDSAGDLLVNDAVFTSTDSGSVLYTASGDSDTFQVSNADNDTWTLTFTPE